jgi:hypothetical protein
MSKQDQVREFIESKRVVQVCDVCERFKIKEPMARRYLNKLKVCVSINCNGSHYVLREQNKFDKKGLLYIGEKVFYNKGKLIDSLVNIVEESDVGFTPPELACLLKTSVHSQLPKLFAAGSLKRAKVPRVRGFVYVSIDSQKRKKQLKARRDSLIVQKENIKDSFDAEAAFDILVTMINKPELAAKGVALSLQRRGKKITSDKVKEIVEHFDISKKNF